jgi:2'-5' RNA ligase
MLMRAAFAILANVEAYNFVRKLAWNLHFHYRTGTIDARLPPHVSLKQPFAISDLDALEEYMDELAPAIEPFELELTTLELRSITHQGRDYGLLWIAVRENPTLRALHNKLNQDLSQRFGDAPADFDGDEFLFHMTVMMGGQAIGVYRAAFAEIASKEVNLRYTASRVAMFLYDEPMGPHGEYLTYKILPIGAAMTAAR